MHFGPIFYIIGHFLLALGGIMMIPAFIDWVFQFESWQGIMQSSGFCLIFGGLSILSNRPTSQLNLTVKETFLMTFVTWVILSFCSSLPFILTNLTPTNTDSFFEGVSALTTTGATIIPKLSKASPGMLLWRALLQWVGGIGIIVMAMTVLPILRIGGLQLFRSEFSDKSEKILPRVSQVTKAISIVYGGLTVSCVVCLWFAGMPIFHAICHGLTTVSTGGMGNFDNSIQAFDSPLIEFVMMIFMIIGGCTLVLFYQLLLGHPRAFFKDTQVRTFLSMILLIPFAVTIWRYLSEGLPFLGLLRESYFNTVSMLSSSGFSSTDFNTWGGSTVIILFTLALIGGCSGSTSGGLKIFRLRIIIELVKVQLYKLYQPHAVKVPTYSGQEISQSVFSSVLMFVSLYGLSIGLLTLFFAACGLDLATCFSGAMSAIANIGPGFGEMIGPSGNYSQWPDPAKWVMMFGMIVGRLELLTVYVVLTPSFWRR